MQQEPWVSFEDIATNMGVSKDTIHRWIRRRAMPAHKVGHIWRFRVSQVDAWVQDGKVSGKRGGRG